MIIVFLGKHEYRKGNFCVSSPVQVDNDNKSAFYKLVYLKIISIEKHLSLAIFFEKDVQRNAPTT